MFLHRGIFILLAQLVEPLLDIESDARSIRAQGTSHDCVKYGATLVLPGVAFKSITMTKDEMLNLHITGNIPDDLREQIFAAMNDWAVQEAGDFIALADAGAKLVLKSLTVFEENKRLRDILEAANRVNKQNTASR